MGKKKMKIGKKMDHKVNPAELPKDVLGLIAGRMMSVMEDYIAFRGVCTSWRSAAHTKKLLCKAPLLMLPGQDGTTERGFYSLNKRRICMRKLLPETKGNRCLDVGFGWVLVLADTKGTAFLFKPFSSARIIKLPSYKKFPGYRKYDARKFYFITRGMLTANPSDTSDFMLLVNTNEKLGSGAWKNRGRKWIQIPIPVQYTVIRGNGMIWTMFCTETPWIEIRDPRAADLSRPESILPLPHAAHLLSGRDAFYLVESTSGELLLVARGDIAEGGRRFGVVRVDTEKGCFELVHDLGKDAIFVGDNVAVSVDATESPGVLHPGCIYFTDDGGTRDHESWPYDEDKDDGNSSSDGNDLGIYCVRDGRVERFDVEPLERNGLICPSLWIFPSFGEV